MKTIITLDNADQPFGYPQLDLNGHLNVTGSFFGTASWAESASFVESASYAATASYVSSITPPFPFTGSAIITGSLGITGSLANGLDNQASGDWSHAEGQTTIASGVSSHAEGDTTQALGTGSHAEGYLTIASGLYSHAEGWVNQSTGQSSHAEGENATASGIGSHAEGGSTQATGPYSHAEGAATQAIGNYSHTEGSFTQATGDYSHAEGSNTSASAPYSHAEGDSTAADGNYSHAEGSNTIALATGSHAEGDYTQASGNYSHAEGEYAVAAGQYSHAEGDNSLASGNYSHAEGSYTVAAGPYSHAEGDSTVATGSYSHAEGSGTTAIGGASHAEGQATIASGVSSHAEGNSTIASGSCSHAEGLGTVASGDYQHVQGQWNISSSAQSAFIVGNGVDNTTRSNLIFAAGNIVQITGSLRVSAGITGSLFGTASSATTASYALTASYVSNAVSASYATTASYVTTAVTASYVLNAVSASYATSALSASYAPAVSLPQANKIYVDSANGVNSTGRGNITTPYLTPEYALADITNTGTVTATTANSSATLTTVSSTANIVIGQFITGAGIPYNSVVVSKTVNTIVLSQVCTASATITATWWTVYEVILNGSFVVTSNLTKQGFYIVNNGHVIWGNFTLFNLNAIFSIPHKLLGKGDYFGTNSLSVFHDITAQQIAGFTYDLDHGIVDTIGTGYAIHHTSTLGVINYIGDYVNAKFGYVLFVETSGFANISFNSYGLLGGIRANSSSCYVTILGNITCPSSVLALNLGSSLVSSNCDIVGSTTASRWVHNGNLQGTTHTIGGATINSGYCSGQIVSSGGHNILNITDTVGVASLSQTATSTVVNNGYIINVSQTAGTLINNGTINTGFLARGTCVNNGVISCADGLTIGVGTVFQNFGKIVTRIDTTGAGWRFENNGYLEVSNTNIDLSTNGTFVNRGRIYNPATADDVFNITSSGVVLENYGEIESGTANTTKSIISKSTGTVKLFAGSRLVVANTTSPIKCTANTSASKNVYYFNAITNCNGSTYGLLFPFDGSSFTPNDLVGGLIYENTNY